MKKLWILFFLIQSVSAAPLLIYEGHIEPQEMVILRSPAAGTVKTIDALLGSEVEPGQALWQIESPELSRSYREAEVNFLEAKQAFDLMNKPETLDPQIQPLLQQHRRNQAQYQRMKERSIKTCQLYESGIVSLDECRQEEQARDDAEAWALESQQALTHARNERKGSGFKTSKLQYENARSHFEEQKTLFQQLNTKAPMRGRLLAPPKQEGVSTQLRKGDRVEEHQAIAVLTPMGQYQVEIAVDELDVASIAVGQTVKAELYALPDVKIEGKVKQIIHQLSPPSEGVLARYKVLIDLNKAEALNNHPIHYGMQVKVEINPNS